ncbi:MAG: hypothetical protein MUO76_22925 [Anaerolineaceae bacterium]|nr:hypothetical protein [Anaerolineaceae bacterium]
MPSIKSDNHAGLQQKLMSGARKVINITLIFDKRGNFKNWLKKQNQKYEASKLKRDEERHLEELNERLTSLFLNKLAPIAENKRASGIWKGRGSWHKQEISTNQKENFKSML